MIQFLRQQSTRWLLLLAIGEMALLVLSVYIAVQLRYVLDSGNVIYVSHDLPLRSAWFALVIGVSMAAMGLYQPHMRESWFGLLTRMGVGFLLGMLALIISYYLVPTLCMGRGVFVIALLLGLALVAPFRIAYLRLTDVDALKRRILVLGAGENAALIHHRMRRRTDRRSFNIIGFVPLHGESTCVPENLITPMPPSLFNYAKAHQVNEIVVGPDNRRGTLPMTDLLECKQGGLMVVELATFFERESGKVKLSLTEPSWLVFSDGFDVTPLRMICKRVFDIVSALLILLLTWPFMLLVALAIMIESGVRAPILYRQERVGERGRVFNLIKFRSMRTDAERDGVARWASKNDDRITRVGRITRKLRLDELPQLHNVLKGEMSIIGPRPERPQFVAELNERLRYYTLRHSVKPGLAGWAQLRYAYGASEEDAEEKLKFDLFYVKNHSLMLDVLILIQTVEVVLFGRGAR
jgi:sugar transferase (PEP-CTERM system associated)